MSNTRSLARLSAVSELTETTVSAQEPDMRERANEVDAKIKAKTQDETVVVDTRVTKSTMKKTEKVTEMTATFATRRTNVTKLLGAHVSISGGVHNAVNNSLQIGFVRDLFLLNLYNA